jgi:hypothetical protein
MKCFHRVSTRNAHKYSLKSKVGKVRELAYYLTAGVIFVNLPETTPATVINAKMMSLLSQRLPVSLLGAVTVVELRRALSRSVRRRS